MLAVGSVFLLALVIENVRTLRLRDVISLSGLAATLGAAAVSSIATGGFQLLIGSIAGAAGLFAICFFVEFARPGTLGFGTVKSSALLGAASGALGQAPWLASLVVLAGGLAFLGLVSLRSRNRSMPTGPAFAIALMSAVVVALMIGG